jgi:Winged helix DNA-binding domain
VTERLLTQRELNRALLARQLLLERAPKQPLAKVLERVAGLQTQYAPSGYIGLWSRVEGFERDELTRALERRSVVQGTLMRITIHLVSAKDYRLFAAGTRRARQQLWLRGHRVTDRKVVKAAKRARALLADGPRRRSELVAELGVDSATWNGIGQWLDLVRAPPSGTWERRSADLYGAADEWLGPADVSKQDGLERLVRAYLGAFGPASLKELANWAGVPPPVFPPVLERIRLRRFRDERGDELLDLPRAPLPDPETPAPVRFLPTWDATLLVHARRSGILPEEYRPRVFHTKTPHSVGTFLVDGRVAGVWKPERRGVKIEPFAKLTRDVRREVDEEAERLAAFSA